MAKLEILREALLRHGVRAEVVARVNGGFGGVTDKSPKRGKARFLSHAMGILDSELVLTIVPREGI